MDNSPTGSKLLISMNVKLQTTFTFSLVALVTVRHCAGWAATKAAAIQPHVSSRPVVLVTQNVRRPCCGQQDENEFHRYIPPATRPSGETGEGEGDIDVN